MTHLVLVVDDEKQMTEIVSFALQTAGFETVVAHDGATAWKLFQSRPISLIILDRMLPDISGATLPQRIRASSDVPIIMLTALGDTEQRVAGLEAGADDYIAKPFSPQELILRAKAIVRRTAPAREEDVSTYGPVTIQSDTVYINSEAADLSEIELKLFRCLLNHHGEIVPVRTLLNEVWETSSSAGGRNLVKTTVYRLRKKLAEAGMAEDTIQSVRGRGYTLHV
ncbi:MAG: response regulator transcription factor [Acidobacteriota bacterium]|nr:response regulator transcription factor [Acidobacteriota bacterium]